ncbi:MAG: acyl-ACP thioesterase [Gemmataceae bacterium]|nr:acyl-ACP thioesterase [Gemmataceae bacterium]
MSSAHAFTLRVAVRPDDIDPQRHVNNVAFVRYVQEAAVAHWRAAAPKDLQASFTWVVRRHEIDYLRPGLPGDELVARTWVGEPAGATWERFTEISRSDGQVLVTARTVWVLLDAATGRLRRVERSMVESLTRALPENSPAE